MPRLLRTTEWHVDGVRDDVPGYVSDHLAIVAILTSWALVERAERHHLPV